MVVVFWLLTYWCHGLLWFTTSPTLPTQQTPKSTTFPLSFGKTDPTRPGKTYLSLIKRNSPVYHVCFTCPPGKDNIEDWKVIELLQAKHLSKDPGRKRLFHLKHLEDTPWPLCHLDRGERDSVFTTKTASAGPAMLLKNRIVLYHCRSNYL